MKVILKQNETWKEIVKEAKIDQELRVKKEEEEGVGGEGWLNWEVEVPVKFSQNGRRYVGVL